MQVGTAGESAAKEYQLVDFDFATVDAYTDQLTANSKLAVESHNPVTKDGRRAKDSPDWSSNYRIKTEHRMCSIDGTDLQARMLAGSVAF